MATRVSFLIPVFNEERHLPNVIACLMAQTYDPTELELVFADGGSTDGTVAIIRRAMDSPARVLLLENPSRNTAIGRNLCLDHATGGYMFNYSGHVYAQPDLVKTVVRILEEKSAPVMGVGVSCLGRAPNAGILGRCIQTVYGTLLGGQGFTDQHRIHSVEEPARSIAFAAYRRELFDLVGGFDEDLWCGQDGEFNLRLQEAGYVLLFTPETYVSLQSGDSLENYVRRMYRYGDAAVLRIRKHPHSFRIYYALPSIGVLLLVALGIGSLRDPRVAGIGFWITTAYVLAGVVSAGVWSRSWKIGVLAPIFYLCMHIGYGLGFLKGLWSAAIGRGVGDGV